MSWEEVGTTAKGSGSGDKIQFTATPVGTIKLRILDEAPVTHWTHWIPEANGGKGLSVNCIGKGCPICAKIAADKKAGNKKKYSTTKTHTVNVFNRNTKQLEILQKGNKIFGQIKTIREQMGDVRNYDISITRTGESLGDINYTVLPVYPPTPIDETLKALKLYDLNEITKDFTAEQINMFLDGKTIDEVTKTETDQEGNTDDKSGMPNVDFTKQV